MTRNLATSADRIAADLEALAQITEPDRPYTRRAFSQTFLQGREWLTRRFAAAGLETQIDAAGNLVGRRRGTGGTRRTLMIGSHSDTVPDGGRFDGVAGVVVALEVARALADQGAELVHDLEVVDFLAEEVSPFGVSCIGSRGMIGERPAEWLARRSGEITLAQGIAKVGGDPDQAPRRDDIAAFLELHIEQGPVLEAEGLDVGVVTAIAGITRIEIVFEGQPDHAGTTPMDRRRDALVAASALTLEVERLARKRAKGPAHFAATVGEFEMSPNAANVVPSRVRMLIDVRSEDSEDLDSFATDVEAVARGISAERGVGLAHWGRISDNPPTPMDPGIMAAFEAGCDSVGARYRRMASGAGHDAAWMARACPVGMVFVPCKQGRSHAPEEWAETEDVTLGAAVVLEAIKRLDAELEA